MRGAAVLVACALGLACADRPVAPPELHLGLQVCEECAMAVADARVAAAMIVEDGGGGRRELLFDDIGCLLAYAGKHGQDRILARYVRDYGGERWLGLESASYLRSTAVPTPMRYGIVAFDSAERAEAVRAERGGEVLRAEALR